jgi:hypothetical protein
MHSRGTGLDLGLWIQTYDKNIYNTFTCLLAYETHLSAYESRENLFLN